MRDKWRDASTATSRNRMAITISQERSNCWIRLEVIAEPKRPPIVAPAASSPNSRLPCSLSKISTMKDQNTETTNRLNTETQMKKARPNQTCHCGSARCSSSANNIRLAAKKR
ncbi:hypothetical protein D3C84_957340 [compost metagenome]